MMVADGVQVPDTVNIAAKMGCASSNVMDERAMNA
jgi:hypothetical protein